MPTSTTTNNARAYPFYNDAYPSSLSQFDDTTPLRDPAFLQWMTQRVFYLPLKDNAYASSRGV